MDSNEIVWGIPAQRTRKTEKYDFPVLTMSAIELKGSNRKFTFNKEAIETLGFVGGESEVKIGFSGNQVFIANGVGCRVAKNNSFSDKKIFEYLVKLWNLNTRVENEFLISKVEQQPYYELITLEEAKEIQQHNQEVPSVVREAAQILKEIGQPTSIRENDDEDNDEDIFEIEEESDIEEVDETDNSLDFDISSTKSSDWE